MLSEEQKGQICGILSVGCDRQTAAHFVGCGIAQIGRAMDADPAFAASVLRAEAAIELSHMRIIQQTAKEDKQWRASVWWLERHAPERFGARAAGKVNLRQLTAFVGMLVDILCDEFQNEDQRRRILARFDETVVVLAEMIRAAQMDSTAASSQLLLEDATVNDGESEIDDPLSSG